MTPFERVQRAVDFIETHLQAELNTAEIAAAACYSSFHFQRLFRAVSGLSVQGYVRQRRLSEAARLLRDPACSVLDAALAYGYQSHEAFSRAFAASFGISPSECRRQPDVFVGQARMEFLPRQGDPGQIAGKAPSIRLHEPCLLIGKTWATSLEADYYADIGNFYREFGETESYLQIPNKAAPAWCYGASYDYHDNGDFAFLVGEQVTHLPEAMPAGFVALSLPGGYYAEFEAHGPVNTVQIVRDYIYGTWLPNARYERSDGPDFEITDVCNSRFPDALCIKVYIPLLADSVKLPRE